MEDPVEDSDDGEEGSESGGVTLTPLRDDAVMTFAQHKGNLLHLSSDMMDYHNAGSVFSVSVDETGSLACSGGEDDQALVWRVADGSVVFQCHGN